MSFVERAIDVTVTLGEGLFGEQVGASYTLSGLRVLAYIASMGGETQGVCNARIFGLPLELINQLTTIGPRGYNIPNQNRIQLDAGVDGQSLTTVYKGWIQEAYGEFQGIPEVSLSLLATAVAGPALQPVPPTPGKGAVDVATVMSQFAATMGFAFENNGVTGALADHYFSGTTLAKIKDCARAAHINYSTDNGVLAIWEKGGYRQGTMPVISPSTGLVGYPSFSSNGIRLRSIFVPSITQGQQFEVAGSQVTPANRIWVAARIVHSLETQTPNGEWFTDLDGYPSYVS